MSKLGHAIETVLSLIPQERLVEDAKKYRFTMIKNGMGFASRDYTGERNWLIIDNQDGRSMVLTGTLYHRFNLEMSVFWWDTDGEKLATGKKMAFKGTEEEALIAHDNIILKFFAICEEEDDVMRRLEGKPTHAEERARKKELRDRVGIIEKRIVELDAEHEKLYQQLDKELDIAGINEQRRKTYSSLIKIEKELETLEWELWGIHSELELS